MGNEKDMKINRRSIIKSGIAIAAGSALPARTQQAASEENSRLIVDAMDLHNVIKFPVERVVIASYYAYEDFTAIVGIEGWAKVVGFAHTPWKEWRAADFAEYAKAIPNLASIPDVGTEELDFDANKIIALKPDVVFLEAFSRSVNAEHVKLLRDANIPIVYFDFQSQSLYLYTKSIVAIGRTMGSKKRTGELIELYEKLYPDVISRTPLAEVGTQSFYAELAEQGPEEVGITDSNRLWAGMAMTLGAENIASGLVPDYGGQLPLETLLKADPDHIFFAGSSWPSYRNGVRTGYHVDAATTQKTLAAYVARPGYDKLKAVKSGNIYAVEHNLAWSLRDVYGMQFMAKQFYPEQYADIDPVAGLREFHERFLPVPFSGTWFAKLT